MRVSFSALAWVLPPYLLLAGAALFAPGSPVAGRLWSAALVVALGVAMSSALSLVVGAVLRPLRATLDSTEERGGRGGVRVPWIPEVADLGGAIETMNELFAERLRRMTRAPLEAQRLRTPRDVVEGYVQRFDPPVSVESEGVAVAARRCGVAAGHFGGARAVPGGVAAFLGSVRPSSGLETALEASAAAAFLHDYLAAGAIESALETGARLFPLASLTGLFIPTDAPQAAVLTLPRGAVQRAVVPLSAQAPLLLHTVEGEPGRRIDEYSHVFRGLPARQLTDSLVESAPPGAEGVVLAVVRT